MLATYSPRSGRISKRTTCPVRMNDCAIHPLIERNPAPRSGIGAKKIFRIASSGRLAECAGNRQRVAVLAFRPFPRLDRALRHRSVGRARRLQIKRAWHQVMPMSDSGTFDTAP